MLAALGQDQTSVPTDDCSGKGVTFYYFGQGDFENLSIGNFGGIT